MERLASHGLSGPACTPRVEPYPIHGQLFVQSQWQRKPLTNTGANPPLVPAGLVKTDMGFRSILEIASSGEISGR